MHQTRGTARDFLRSQSIVKKRRKRRLFRLFVNLIILLILIGGFSWLSWLQKMAIRNVVVVGNSSVQAVELQGHINTILDGKYIGLISKRNAIIYPKKEIFEFILQKYPRIADVNISTDGLHILNIVVEERKPLAGWCGPLDCYFIDQTSYIYDKISGSSNLSTTSSSTGSSDFVSTAMLGASAIEGLIIFHGNDDVVGPTPITKTVFTKEKFEGIMAVAKALESQSDKIKMLPTDVYVKNGESIIFKIKNNGRIIISDKRSFEESLENLKSALSSPIFSKTTQFEYIDVRFSNKVFYRLKGGVEATSTSSV